MRILVVDDAVDAVDALARLLTAQGHQVTVAHDGAAGIAAGVAGQFDVAILDIGLRDIDGYGVAKALRAHHGNGVRILAYTGFSGRAVEQRARDSGFDRIIMKPATVSRLLAAFSQHDDI